MEPEPASKRVDARSVCLLASAILVLAARSPRAYAGEIHLGGRLETLGIVRFDDASPRQRPLGRIDLFAEQALTSQLRWRLSTTGRWGGTKEDASGAGLVDFGHTFQNIDPSLELDDAWVEWLGDTLDVKLGNQKFTWGRLDGVKPNDQLNPYRYYDPLISDENDTKIAVPAAAFSYYFPESWRSSLPEESRVTLVWEPIAVPWLFPESKERWFAPAARTNQALEISSLEGVTPDPCPCLIDITQTLRNSSPPARRFDNGNLGFRLSGRSAGIDWAAVYFDGFATTPAFTVPVRLLIQDDASTPTVFEATAQTELVPAYRRYRSLGVDGSAVQGGATLRFEAAWKFRKPYPRDVRSLAGDVERDPMLVSQLLRGDTITLDAFAERDAVEWGIGADYLIEGYLPLLELYQVILLHNDTPLLIRDVDSRIAASVRKLWLADRLETKLLGLWGIESGYELARLELTYAVSDELEVRAGVLGIWGDSVSLIGQFKDNSEAYARIRYSF